ncbi:hypothetical protein PV10_08686 [Exophiala mesophila]|uniref:Uncharacterized protein n=1 Tax=Exophiala mesophila TaxID=212818 RepID=A0A0D1XLM1_EXOME|nr:uncharacterized protein PV10_08686 [Exophiala mesophila]KIV89076.1 hypothetical protein PV10_08686 [Exophiala mesophila]
MAPPVDQIRHVTNPDGTSYTYYPLAVIGAGESGIAMGCRLRQVLGFDQFRIFERKSGLGGTWYANTYPGIACDVPAILYSYSFAQNPYWTTSYPSGAEIVEYLYQVCAKFGVLDKIQCDTSVKSCRWLEDQQEWELVLEHLAPGVGDLATYERNALEAQGSKTILRTEIIRAKVVASAVGGLVEPKPPLDVPGLDTFKGDVVHTARWNKDVSFRDKNVVVVGTGCSAGQVVPALLKPEYGVKHITQLMRSPPWVAPAFGSHEVQFFKTTVPKLSRLIPGFQNALRKLMFTVMELEFIALFRSTEASRANRAEKAKQLLRYLHKKVPEEYHEILTPDYEVFCKRRVMDDGWFASLGSPKVDLTTLPLTSVQSNSVTLGPGRHYPPLSKTSSHAPVEEKSIPADVIVLAHGYATNEWLHPLEVIGRNNKSLSEVWDQRGGPQAYMGTAMDGFPNFFLIFGPNTATGHSSVILASENMVNYSLKFIAPILKGDIKTYEVTEAAERKWTSDLQSQLRKSIFVSGGCHNWYTNDKGWNSATYPRAQIDFTLRCWFPVWSHWKAQYTSKGLAKWRLSLLLKLFAIAGLGYGGLFIARNGKNAAKEIIFTAIKRLRQGLARAIAPSSL